MSPRIAFIVGAGASSEYNFPTGPGLKKNIAQLLSFRFEFDQLKSGDDVICSAIRQYCASSNENFGTLLEAAHAVKTALPLAISIDNFLDAHRGKKDIELVGKLAIVRAILKAELGSALHLAHGKELLNYEKVPQTWLIPFFQLLTENCQLKDLKARLSRISIVSFNYDRSIEHFLYFSFMNYYRIGNAESAELVESIEIVHPYGTVGALTFQAGQAGIGYGGQPNSPLLLQLSARVNTFTEGIRDGHQVPEFWGLEKLVFLGFAFHKQNLELLFPNRVFPSNDLSGRRVRCVGTAYNISPSDRNAIIGSLQRPFENRLDIDLSENTCYNFLGEFWRTLAF